MATKKKLSKKKKQEYTPTKVRFPYAGILSKMSPRKALGHGFDLDNYSQGSK